MSPPNPDCKIEAVCAVNLSESQDKVRTAVTNVFPDCKITYENYSIMATSENIESLESIREYIHSRQIQKTYRRILERHADKDSTWFYLNRQAAFAKKIVICEEASESPLGPIKVHLTSNDIEGMIGWIINAKN